MKRISKNPDYKDLDFYDPLKLLKTKEKLEKLRIKEKRKYEEDLEKKRKSVTRRKKVLYDPTKEVILWEGEKKEILPGAYFQPVIARYNDSSPRFFVLIFRDNFSGGKYTKVVVRRIPYEVFLVFLEWLPIIQPQFEKAYLMYMKERDNKVKQRLKNKFTFSTEEEVQELEETEEFLKTLNL